MSNPEYLDKTGLDELVSQTKSYVGNKVSKKIDKPVNVQPGKVLQTDSHGNPVWGDSVPQADIVDAVENWLEENIDPGTAVTLDPTLTEQNAAAQAKAVGDAIDNLKENLVVVDDDEPESDDNVIWVPETPENEVVVPTISELNEVAGTVAKDYADLTFPIKAGTLCRHNYGLYAAKQDIPTQETWNSGHWSTKTNIADKLDSLSSAINVFEPYNYSVTSNLLSLDTLTNGYRLDTSTGGLIELSTHSVTDFMPVDGETVYYASVQNQSVRQEISSTFAPKFCFYNSSKEFIENSGTDIGHATSPANAKYMRFSCYNLSSITTIMIGKSIEPYVEALTISEAYKPAIELLENNIDNANNDIKSIGYVEQTDSIGSELDWTSGYVTKGGRINASSSYHYSESISVAPGDVISSSNSFRFVTAYVNGNAVESLGAESVSSYTVPNTVDAIIVTLEPTQTSVNHTYKTLFDGMANHVKAIEEKIDGATFNNDKTVFQANAASLTNGQTLTACANIDNKKGDTIIFYANLNNASFESVTVGHGGNVSYGASVTIDKTKATISSGTTADYYHVNHGLTIDKFLMVKIKHTDNARADIQIETASGQFSIASSNVSWGGCIGDVFAKSTNSSLTNATLSCTFADFEQDIFLFGDSYVGLGDSGRYTTVLVNNGYTNLMIDGYGGRNSASAMQSFRQIIQAAKPKYLIWALGMNDVDSSTAINASYKTCVDEVIATCEIYSVIPILATIPNTPTRINTFKNAYVKSLGYRFIDFAAAVGAEAEGSTWWDGMLEASDIPANRVHPTVVGAQALYARFLIDVPEIADLH